MEQSDSTIHRRNPQGSGQDSLSERDRAPESPGLSPIISHATLEELSSPARPPDTPFSAYLLPYQYISFLFPFTLLVGSAFGYVAQDSYFKNKRNILNVLFVKNGWGWTSLVFLVYLVVVFGKGLTQQDSNDRRPQEQSNHQQLRTRTGSRETSSSTSQPAQGTATRVRVVFAKALIRWGLATLYWWLVSQWFFGPAVFDRLYVLSGGSCSVNGHFTQHHCRRAGGDWGGGIDVSGHMFLLTHASLFLIEELSVFLNDPKAWTSLQHRLTAKYAVWSVVAVCALWWWMMLMTTVYFHHLAERLSGLFFGMLFWVGTYVTSYKLVPPPLHPFMPDQTVILELE